MKETILQICNMKDPLCASGIEKKLSNIPGVHSVHSNPINGTTSVHHDEDAISLEKLKQEVDNMGLYCHCEALPEHHGRIAIKVQSHEGESAPMTALPALSPEMDHGEMHHPAHEELAEVAHKPMEHKAQVDHALMDHDGPEEHEGMDHAVEDHSAHGGHPGMTMADMAIDMRNRFILALALTIPIFLYSPLASEIFKLVLPVPFGLDVKIWSFLLTTPVVAYGGIPFYRGARHALSSKVLNMSVLVTISVLAGYIFSVAATFLFEGDVFYEAAAMLTTFVLFGHWVEMRARAGTSSAIEAMLSLVPPKATVIRGGEELTIATDDVLVGDKLLIRPGDKVPVDAVVVEGESACPAPGR